MLTNMWLRTGIAIVVLLSTTGCLYTRDMWHQANQTRTRFNRLDSQTIGTPKARFIVARYYLGAEASSFNIPLNDQGKPMPPYDFPAEGFAGFKLAEHGREQWAKGRGVPGGTDDPVSPAGSTLQYQWHAELGDNKVAAAYRFKDGGRIEPVIADEGNLLDVVGPRADCIFVVLPLERPRPQGAVITAKITACVATPFSLARDTVCLPMELFLIGLASGMS
jgi:hypothetical protein